MPTNDNDSAGKGGATAASDPHGYAALLLVESLIHGLCERSVLSIAEAIDIVDRAADVQHDVAELADGEAAPMWRSHALLAAIAVSLRADGDGGSPRLVP